MGELLVLAAEAAGGQHHLAVVQLPVSLVTMTPIVQVLQGRDPLTARRRRGELPGMVDQECADLIQPGLIPAQACVLAVASCPGVTNVPADAVAQPSVTAAKLRAITGVLASP
ncbi:hypothetical protein [Streptomyces sp. NPDC006334]|uniref:hypothetical protein n=1 Tax=Streptomyces sp. NPDC006334 TaxID=3156754 RepID=UPI0033B265C8